MIPIVRWMTPLLLGFVAACAASPDPAPFVGTWRFADGAEINVLGSQDIGGTLIRVTTTPQGLDLDLGCRCHVPMIVDGERARVVSRPGTSCVLVVLDIEAQIELEEWTLEVPSDERPGDQLRVQAHGKVIGPATPVTISSTRLLRNQEDRKPPCGGETAVGVVPYMGLYPARNSGACPWGMGMEGVFFRMDGVNDDGCSTTSGVQGEPPWDEPDAARHLPDSCPDLPDATDGVNLPFCRVDGDLFTPPAPGDEPSAYAVLKLGLRCPEGSFEIAKHITNDPVKSTNQTAGLIAPNRIDKGPNASTDLFFCLFQSTAPGTVIPKPFPDLVAPYAVFHDFDGFQPPWIASKRWLQIDEGTPGGVDGNGIASGDGYVPPVGANTQVFKQMVKHRRAPNGHVLTTFDLGRVR